MQAGEHRGEHLRAAEQVCGQVEVGPALLQGFQVARLAKLGDQKEQDRARPTQDKGQHDAPAEYAAPGQDDEGGQAEDRQQKGSLGVGKDGQDK